MSRKVKSTIETLMDLSGLIKEMSHEVDVVIVEGTHDEVALRSLGFKGLVVKYSSSRLSESELIDKLTNRFKRGKVAILTDFDEEGEVIAKKLTAKLASLGVKVEQYYRDRMASLLEVWGLKTIESIFKVKQALTMGGLLEP